MSARRSGRSFTFDDLLQEKFFSEHVGKGESYEQWLENLSIEELIELGDEYGRIMYELAQKENEEGGN